MIGQVSLESSEQWQRTGNFVKLKSSVKQREPSTKLKNNLRNGKKSLPITSGKGLISKYMYVIHTTIKRSISSLPEGPNRRFSQRDIPMAHRGMGGPSAPQTTRLCIKSGSPAWAQLPSERQEGVLVRVWIGGNSHALLEAVWTGLATTENGMKVPQGEWKEKIELPYDPEAPRPGMCTKPLKRDVEKISATPCSWPHCSVSHSSQDTT